MTSEERKLILILVDQVNMHSALLKLLVSNLSEEQKEQMLSSLAGQVQAVVESMPQPTIPQGELN